MKLTHVPDRGSAPAITDLLGGHIEFQFDNISALLPYLQHRSLRALAVSSKTSPKQLPQLRPLAEQGFPNYEVLPWFGLWLPKGASPETLANLNHALAKIYAKPEFLEKLKDSSITPSYIPGESFDRFIRAEQEKWRTVVRKAGLKV